jgi:hypothetical protein
MKTRPQTALLGLALLASAPLQAAEWKHELAPYLWGSSMNGASGIGDLTVNVDASFGDILDNLEMGFMGVYRASREKLSVTADVVYMGLGSTGTGPQGYVRGDVEMDQLAVEVDVGYELAERFVVFGGLRYNDLSLELDTTGPLGTRSADADESWVDPVIGVHYTIPFADDWSVMLRGDIGGFGVGSDFAWQAVTTLRWQASPRIGALAAYRYMDMDYEDGEGSNAFKYDLAFSGPALGIVFTF